MVTRPTFFMNPIRNANISLRIWRSLPHATLIRSIVDAFVPLPSHEKYVFIFFYILAYGNLKLLPNCSTSWLFSKSAVKESWILEKKKPYK